MQNAHSINSGLNVDHLSANVRFQEHPVVVVLHRWLEITFPRWPAGDILRSPLARVWKDFFIHQGTKNGFLLIYLLSFESFFGPQSN